MELLLVLLESVFCVLRKYHGNCFRVLQSTSASKFRACSNLLVLNADHNMYTQRFVWPDV